MVSGMWMEYEIDPVEVKHVDQEDDRCIQDSDDVKNIWECLVDHMYKDMNCSLPWSSKGDGANCTLAEDYDSFQAKILKDHFKSDPFSTKDQRSLIIFY